MKKKIIILMIIINILIPVNFYTIVGSSFFDSSTTFSSKFLKEEDVMPYAVYTPSSVNNYESIPLIVWLHGSGEVSYEVGESGFMNAGLPAILNNWNLEGFNAYILCPQNNGSWNNPTSKDKLQKVIDKFIMEHNVDTNNIIICGHSMGGRGALYMAHQMPEYFSKCVVLSGYNPGVDISEIEIPVKGYVGTIDGGEDSASVSYMNNVFASTFGNENAISLKTSHGKVPKIAFNLDQNNNNCSDLIEWALGDYIMNPVLTGIELNETSLNLRIGETSTLSVLPQPTTANLSGKTVNWKSADESIVKVSQDGIITAVGAGNTKITATVLSFTVECNVTVSEEINLNLKETTIIIPKQQIKKLTVMSDDSLEGKNIIWHSSNELVARVDENGVVTGLNEGTAIITASVKQKLTEVSEIETSATCKVTVSGQLGDIDKDNNITAYDAYKALEASVDYLIGIKVDEKIVLRADVNRNGIPEAQDAYKILKYSVGLINEF